MSYAQKIEELIAERDKALAEIARLRAQEPVAWMDDFGNAFPLAANKGAGSWMDEHKRNWKPLYRAAPPAQPAEPVAGWVSVPVCLTPEMREVLLMADRFTVGEVYIMLLAAAPKASHDPR
jgi:hypothetical protein